MTEQSALALGCATETYDILTEFSHYQCFQGVKSSLIVRLSKTLHKTSPAN